MTFNEHRIVERVYSDASAAHERAWKWKQLGLTSICIQPTTRKGRRIYVLTATATNEQVRKL
jgi:hypothetical protein